MLFAYPPMLYLLRRIQATISQYVTEHITSCRVSLKSLLIVPMRPGVFLASSKTLASLATCLVSYKYSYDSSEDTGIHTSHASHIERRVILFSQLFGFYGVALVDVPDKKLAMVDMLIAVSAHHYASDSYCSGP